MAGQLAHLTPIELLLLQKHIKLGKEHLSQTLSSKEIAELFDLTAFDKQTEQTISTDALEISGKMSLAINTIFTSTLGLWMGLSGFLRYSLDSIGIFVLILLFATFVGGSIGFLNYQITKKEACKSIENKKKKTIEILILKNLNQQRKKQINDKVQEIESILKNLKIKDRLDLADPQFNDHQICLKWLNQIDIQEIQEKKEIGAAFKSQLEAVKKGLQEHLARDQKNRESGLAKMIQKLKKSSIHPSIVTWGSWIRKNIRQIIVSLAPIGLSSFSSAFVYFDGAPRIAKEMGETELYQFLTQPFIRYLEIGVALCISIYFVIAFFQVNLKAF
jgi:hypothetical protein